MKQLILVRHAKSSWGKPKRDIDRPLTTNGIVKAETMARRLRESIDFVPEYWLSSVACRAMHTGVLFAKEFHTLSSLRLSEELYTFSGEELLDVIHQLPAHLDSAILFGHNDAIRLLVNTLTEQRFLRFPTASSAWISFSDSQWKHIEKGTLQQFITKKNKMPDGTTQVY